MTTAVKSAFGTVLSRDGNDVAELTNISGPSISLETIDATSHGSDDTYREFIAGLRDGGDITIEGNFIPSDTDGQVGLLTDLNAGTVQSFVITFPAAASSTTWTFSAIVTAFETTAPFEGKLGFTATLKISGKPTLGVTASTGLTTPFFSISESAVIVPSAANAVYNYVATVLTGVTSVTVTPTATAGTITVQGNTVATGEASSAITLGAAGSITEITIVVTETNKSPKTYTIWLTRAAS